MSKTKNMHYLSQTISRNFIIDKESKTFLEYNPISKNIKPRNIVRLFSKRNIWGQDFEKVLNGNDYENKLAVVLKSLVSKSIEKGREISGEKIIEAQFNAVLVEKESEQILSKLILQTVLLQRSEATPDKNIEELLSSLYQSMWKELHKILLVEVNPSGNYPPLVLIDGMLFVFISPDPHSNSLGHVCFMFPISEKRFLLWVSQPEDYRFFAAKYSDINFLNLSRIEQNDKKCRIALPKSEKNEKYLRLLTSQIDTFTSNESISIHLQRKWE